MSMDENKQLREFIKQMEERNEEYKKAHDNKLQFGKYFLVTLLQEIVDKRAELTGYAFKHGSEANPDGKAWLELTFPYKPADTEEEE